MHPSGRPHTHPGSGLKSLIVYIQNMSPEDFRGEIHNISNSKEKSWPTFHPSKAHKSGRLREYLRLSIMNPSYATRQKTELEKKDLLSARNIRAFLHHFALKKASESLSGEVSIAQIDVSYEVYTGRGKNITSETRTEPVSSEVIERGYMATRKELERLDEQFGHLKQDQFNSAEQTLQGARMASKTTEPDAITHKKFQSPSSDGIIGIANAIEEGIEEVQASAGKKGINIYNNRINIHGAIAFENAQKLDADITTWIETTQKEPEFALKKSLLPRRNRKVEFKISAIGDETGGIHKFLSVEIHPHGGAKHDDLVVVARVLLRVMTRTIKTELEITASRTYQSVLDPRIRFQLLNHKKVKKQFHPQELDILQWENPLYGVQDQHEDIKFLIALAMLDLAGEEIRQAYSDSTLTKDVVRGEACIYKKVSGSTTAFLISICE